MHETIIKTTPDQRHEGVNAVALETKLLKNAPRLEAFRKVFGVFPRLPLNEWMYPRVLSGPPKRGK